MSTEALPPLALRARVIGALMMREVHTRYGRDNIGFLWFVGEPMLFTGGVIILWSLIRPLQEKGLPLAAFLMTGYLPLVLWRHCVFRAVRCFQANSALLYHRQVRVIDLILSRVIIEIAGVAITYAIIFTTFFLLGLIDPPTDLGLFYLGWLYIVLFSVGCALVIAPLSERSDVIERLVGPFTYFMLPASGAFVMLDWMPAQFRPYVLLVPMADGIELIRAGQFGAAIHSYYNIPYVTYACAVLIVLGLILARGVQRHMEIE